MGIWDGFGDFLNNFIQDGAVIAGDCFGIYDKDHANKVKELINIDQRYLYLIQKKCGLDPYNEDYYGDRSGTITIVNIDHFAIKASKKSQLEDCRKIVYTAIDEVYNASPEERDAQVEDMEDHIDDPWEVDEDEDY